MALPDRAMRTQLHLSMRLGTNCVVLYQTAVQHETEHKMNKLKIWVLLKNRSTPRFSLDLEFDQSLTRVLLEFI